MTSGETIVVIFQGICFFTYIFYQVYRFDQWMHERARRRNKEYLESIGKENGDAQERTQGTDPSE